MGTSRKAQGEIWSPGDFSSSLCTNPSGLFLTSHSAILEIMHRTKDDRDHPGPSFVGVFGASADEESTFIELITLHEKDFSSGFALRVKVSYKAKDGSVQKKHMHWIATAINAVENGDDVEDFLIAEHLTSGSTPSTSALTSIFSALSVREQESLIKLTFRAPKSLHTSNLFTTQNNFGSQTESIELIRRELTLASGFSLVVKDKRALNTIKIIKQQMQQQIKHGFVNRWFKTENAEYESIPGTLAHLGISTKAITRGPTSFRYLARTSFASPEQFLMITVLAVEKEHQLDKAEPRIDQNVRALFYSVPSHPEVGKFIFALKPRADKESKHLRLQKGDTFHLSPGTTYMDNDSYYCQVESTEAITGQTVVMGIIEHRRSMETGAIEIPGDWYGTSQDFAEAKANLRRALGSSNAKPVSICLKFSQTTRDFQIHCLELWQMLVAKRAPNAMLMKELTLGNRPDLLPKVNILGGFKQDPQDPSAVENYLGKIFGNSLSKEQTTAFKLIKSVSGGVLVIDGCAGSGKSRFTRQIMLARTFRENEDGERIKIAVPVAQNETGDTIVRRLQQDAESMKVKLGTDYRPIILRAYKITAEHQNFGEKRDQQKLPVGNVRVDNALVDALEEYTERPPKRFYKINAGKVQERELSVGWFMAKLLGLVDRDTRSQVDETAAQYKDLRRRLIWYHDGKNFHRDMIVNRQLENRMRKGYNDLLRDALSLADVLVFTTTQALDPAYRERFNAGLMVIDEASQINDAAFAALQAAYRNVKSFVLAGDCKQLGVFSKDRVENPVLVQWKKSIHQRFRDLGYTTAMFYEQHRCTSDVAKLVSQIYYHGDIRALPETREREDSVKYRRFNQQNFGIDSNVVLIDVSNTSPDQNDTSWFCLETADVVKELVAKHGEGEASNIFTLTPYKQQMQVHNRRMKTLASQRPGFWKANKEDVKVVSQTLMGIQGAENKIVIMDLTIGERIGFLKDDGHTLVGCSRASDALYIVGDVSELKKMRDYRTLAIGRLVQYCEDQGLVGVKPMQSYINGEQEKRLT